MRTAIKNKHSNTTIKTVGADTSNNFLIGKTSLLG